MEPKWRLRRIGILSAVKMGGVLSSAIGFIAGTIWGTILAFFSSLISMVIDKPVPGLGAAAVIIMPFFFAVLYGILGTLMSFLLSLLYNLLAGLLGGVEFELGFERKEDSGTFV